MTAAAGVLLAAAGVAAVVDWAAVAGRTGRVAVERVAKPATLALLIGAAATLEPASGAARAWFLVALVLSLVGDVALMPPGDRFVAGLAAFLLAHVAFVGGFVVGDEHHLAPALAGAVLVALALASTGRVVVRAAGRRSPSPSPALAGPALAGPVAAYAGVLSAMVVAGWSTGEAAAMAGTTLFLVSDGVLAWRRFVGPVPGGRVTVHATYHVAQALLVLSLTG